MTYVNPGAAKDIRIRAGLVEKVREILENHHNLAQAAIAFCLSYPEVSTVIPGNTSSEQLESNLKSAENPLPIQLARQLEDFCQQDVQPLELPWQEELIQPPLAH